MPHLTKTTLDGNLQTFILAVLVKGPSYGYQIVQDLNELGGGLLKLGEGTIYPVLHRMEERGLIDFAWRAGPNGRQRKYYRLTPKGRKALAANRQQWQGLVAVMRTVLGPLPEPSSFTASPGVSP